VVRLGDLLIRAKALCGHGRFEAWFLCIGADYSRRVAREAMLAARRAKPFAPVLARFLPSAARILCRPKVAESSQLQDALLALARQQTAIGYSAAREVLTDHDPHDLYPRKLDWEEKEKKESAAEALARRITDLVTDEKVDTVMIHADHDDECPTVSISVLGEKRRTVTSRYLASALECVVGDVKERHCRNCKNDLPVSMFSKQTRRCKLCERARVGAWMKKRRAARTTVVGPAPPALS
jgi:hypothetical protein